MRLGSLLGGKAREEIERQIEKAEDRELVKKRAREISRQRRLGKTVRYSREDGR